MFSYFIDYTFHSFVWMKSFNFVGVQNIRHVKLTRWTLKPIKLFPVIKFRITGNLSTNLRYEILLSNSLIWLYHVIEFLRETPKNILIILSDPDCHFYSFFSETLQEVLQCSVLVLIGLGLVGAHILCFDFFMIELFLSYF